MEAHAVTESDGRVDVEGHPPLTWCGGFSGPYQWAVPGIIGPNVKHF